MRVVMRFVSARMPSVRCSQAGDKFASQQSNVDHETEVQARQSSMASPSQLANDEEVVQVTENKALRE